MSVRSNADIPLFSPPESFMNYRHAYHAGNFADVLKHLVLTQLIQGFKRKDKPFAYLDTHAGSGMYDLRSEQAGKTGEWRSGIDRLWRERSPQGALAEYLGAVKAAQPEPGSGPTLYPGSPWLAAHLLRPQDRLLLIEKHPEEAALLRQTMGRDSRVAIHQRDGFEALGALLPLSEKRTLILIDPPFEQEKEFEAMQAGLQAIQRKAATATVALWYPLKDAQAVARFHRGLKGTGIKEILLCELWVRDPKTPAMLVGSGLALVRPPFQTDAALKAVLPQLTRTLTQGEGAGFRLEWLVAE